MKFIENGKVLSFENYLKTSAPYAGWRIAIPSYKRAATLRDKTLSALMEYGVNPSLIDIFVANDEQRLEYEATLKRNTYNRIVVGVVGMGAIRCFIQDYYKCGQRLVCLDDDLKELYMVNAEGKPVDIANLTRLFDYAFYVCAAVKTGYFGVYAVDNPYFMKRQISLGLRYLIGSFWGMVVNHDRFTYVTMDDKEDYERSVRAYLKYGNVVRLDFVGMKSNYYKEPGGMQVTRTERRIAESGMRLERMFPDQVRKNGRRKEHYEVELVEQRQAHKKVSRAVLRLA